MIAIDPAFGWFGVVTGIISVGAAAFVSLRKVGPERTSILIEAGESLVVAATGVTERLEAENQRLRADLTATQAEVAAMRSTMRTFEDAQHQLGQLREENERLAAEVTAWKNEARKLGARVKDLETEVHTLKNGNGQTS